MCQLCLDGQITPVKEMICDISSIQMIDARLLYVLTSINCVVDCIYEDNMSRMHITYFNL